MGFKSDKVVSATDTEIVLEWTNGVPVYSDSQRPTLYFNKSSEAYYAITDQNLTNAITVTENSPADIKCSFAGGCKFELQASGIATQFIENP